jgi:hypothetical protein
VPLPRRSLTLILPCDVSPPGGEWRERICQRGRSSPLLSLSLTLHLSLPPSHRISLLSSSLFDDQGSQGGRWVDQSAMEAVRRGLATPRWTGRGSVPARSHTAAPPQVAADLTGARGGGPSAKPARWWIPAGGGAL